MNIIEQSTTMYNNRDRYKIGMNKTNNDKEMEQWLKETKKKLKREFGDFAIGLDDVELKK